MRSASSNQSLALASRRWRRVGEDGTLRRCKCAGKEGVCALGFDGIEVVLAQAQQAEVALQNVAVGDARAHGEGGVHQGVQVDALEVFANQGQTRLAAQVLGQLLDHKVAHLQLRFFHPQGGGKMECKLLI